MNKSMDHPLNNSSSKQSYSFGRAGRFAATTKHVTSKTFFYNLPSGFDKRTYSIGRGQRSDFAKLTPGENSPAPTSYNVNSEFQRPGTAPRSWSFGVSRKAFEKVYIKGMKGTNPTNPGPGSYYKDFNFGHNAQKYTLTGKSGKNSALLPNKYTPGPGSYTPKDTLHGEGKYFVSKFRSTGMTKIGPTSPKRASKSNEEGSPGPSSYSPRYGFTPGGNYYVSSYRSSNARSFGRAARGELIERERLQTPGPGEYGAYSEFEGGAYAEYSAKYSFSSRANGSTNTGALNSSASSEFGKRRSNIGSRSGVVRASFSKKQGGTELPAVKNHHNTSTTNDDEKEEAEVSQRDAQTAKKAS